MAFSYSSEDMSIELSSDDSQLVIGDSKQSAASQQALQGAQNTGKPPLPRPGSGQPAWATSATQPNIQSSTGSRQVDAPVRKAAGSSVQAPRTRPQPSLISMPDVPFASSNSKAAVNSNSLGARPGAARHSTRRTSSAASSASAGNLSSDVTISFSDEEDQSRLAQAQSPWQGAYSAATGPVAPDPLSSKTSEVMSFEGQPTMTRTKPASDGRSSPEQESFSVEFSDVESTASSASDQRVKPSDSQARLAASTSKPINHGASFASRPSAGTGATSMGHTQAGSLSSSLSGGTTRLPLSTSNLRGTGGTSRLGMVSTALHAPKGSTSSTSDISFSSESDGGLQHNLPAASHTTPNRHRAPIARRHGSSGSNSSGGPAVKLGDMADLMDMLADDYVPDLDQRSSRAKSSSVTPTVSGTSDNTSSDDHRPKLMTVEDLEAMSDLSAASSKSQSSRPSRRPSSSGQDKRSSSISHTAHSSHHSSSSKRSSSSSKGYRSRVLTVDALEAMSLPGSLKDSWDEASVSSKSSGSYAGRQVRSSRTASSHAPSHTASATHASDDGSDPDGGRPNIMTMADLPAIEEIEHAFRSNQEKTSNDGRDSSSIRSSSNKSTSAGSSDEQDNHWADGSAHGDGAEVDDLLAGLVMVRQGGDSSSDSSGDAVGRSGLRKEDAELWPINEGNSSQAATSRSPTQSAMQAGSTSDTSELQTASELGDDHMLTRDGAEHKQAGYDMSQSSEDRLEVLGGRAPTWTTKAAADQPSYRSNKQLVVEEWAAPYKGTSAQGRSQQQQAEFKPLPAVGSFAGAPGVPAVVFGKQHASTSLHSVDGLVTGRSISHQVVDLIGVTDNHYLPGGMRSVCIQVGSMNEVATQVAYDACRGKLVEGATSGPLVYPSGLHGIKSNVAGARWNVQPALGGTNARAGPHSGVADLGHASGTTALGSLEGMLAQSMNVRLQATQQPCTAPNHAAMLGGGWGVLSCAVQNLKAAALLEQLETMSGQIKGLVEMAAVATAATHAPPPPSQHDEQPATAAANTQHHAGANMATTPPRAHTNLSAVLAQPEASLIAAAHTSPFEFAAASTIDRKAVQQQSHADDAELSAQTCQVAQTISDETYSASFETEGSQQGDQAHNSISESHTILTCQPSSSFPRAVMADHQSSVHGRTSFKGKGTSLSGLEKLPGHVGLHTGHGVSPGADPASMSASSVGPGQHVSMRRQSTVGEHVIPEHHHMDLLPRPSAGTPRPATAVPKPADVLHPARQPNDTPPQTAVPMLDGGRDAAVSTGDDHAYRQHAAAHARDTLLRYHVLLSSGALPGGLLDPASIARVRCELVAGAAAAAATTGLGFADIMKESSDRSSFKHQVLKLRGQLATTLCTGQAVAAPGGLRTQGWPAGGIDAGGSSSEGRLVMLDRISFGKPSLVDVGGMAYTRFKYTTLEETMQFIKAYKPARLA